jgi:hypothetical protein
MRCLHPVELTISREIYIARIEVSRCSLKMVLLYPPLLFLQVAFFTTVVYSTGIYPRQATDMTMEAAISTFVESLNVSSEIASNIASTYAANDELPTLLSNDTLPAAQKRSLPILTPLACWTFKLLLGSNVTEPSSDTSVIDANW